MILSYRYRMYPNATQAAQLERVLDVACHVYNDIAHTAKLAYASGEKWSWMAVDAFWRQERHQYECIQRALPAESVADLLKRYDRNLKSFWALRKNGREDAHPPDEVPRARFGAIGYRYGKGGIQFAEGYEGGARLQLWSVEGRIRVHYHRPVPEGWQIKHVMVTQTKREEWYVVLQIEDKMFAPSPAEGEAIGICVTVDDERQLLALSTGEIYENPRWYRSEQARRTRLQRQADRQRRAGNPG